jgi:serine/threonine-protein kinase PknK
MIQSIACVPIRGAPPLGRTIGALYLETRLRPGVRFEQELPTLSAFADQAAIAIENARLLAENRERADRSRRQRGAGRARDELARLLGKRTEQLAEARRDLKQVRAELRSHFGYAGLVGTSARCAASTPHRPREGHRRPLLVTGESGTGKEMVARAVHTRGRAAKKPFLGVNCGAIPANLLESELFGSVRGAFTGADRDRRGLFQEATGARSCSTRSASCPSRCSRASCACSRRRPCARWAHARRAGRRACHRGDATATSSRWWRRGRSGRTSTTASTSSSCTSRRCASASTTSRRSSTTSSPLFAARYRRERKTISRDALRKLCAYPWPGNVRQLEHVLLSAWLMSDKATRSGSGRQLDLPAAARLTRRRRSQRGNGRARALVDREPPRARTASPSTRRPSASASSAR